jgi:hypothetical protein
MMFLAAGCRFAGRRTGQTTLANGCEAQLMPSALSGKAAMDGRAGPQSVVPAGVACCLLM